MTEPITFNWPHKVKFADCDPAGIVFYPRYVEMIHNTVEDFLENIGFGYTDLIIKNKKGVPTVHLDIDFNESSRLGDKLSFNLRLKKIGTSSLAMTIDCLHGDDLRLSANMIIVHIDLATNKSEPWPNEMRTKFTDYLIVEED